MILASSTELIIIYLPFTIDLSLKCFNKTIVTLKIRPPEGILSLATEQLHYNWLLKGRRAVIRLSVVLMLSKCFL